MYPWHIFVCVFGGTYPRAPWGSWEKVSQLREGEKVLAVFVSRLAESPVGLHCKAIISGGVRDLSLVTEEEQESVGSDSGK